MFLLVGDYRENNGPNNVNKKIIQYKSSRFMHVCAGNRYFKFFDALIKLLFSRVLVISGVSRLGVFLLKAAKLLGKKTAYIMHGCAQYEAQINGIFLSERDVNWENTLLEGVDLLLPVSQTYSEWVKRQYPQYAEKTKFWQLGQTYIPRSANCDRETNTIAAAGGDLPLKNNLVVSDAVEKLEGVAKLIVYGPLGNGMKCDGKTNTEWVGHLDHEQFLAGLRKSQLFVVNSVIESFNISVMEALQCGCSILISQNVGAAELLALTDNDMVLDINDADEIAQKILFLMKYPNNERIYASIDWQNIGYDKAVERLEKLCEALSK